MNHIEIKKIQTTYGYTENDWVIDEKTLPEYLDAWKLESKDEYLKSMGSFEGLCPAWNKDIDWMGVVIVVEVEKTDDFVYWNRIGYVLHENEDFEEEKKCGILYTDFYSGRYRDNICWIKNTDWVFDRTEYRKMVNSFREIQTMEQLKRIEREESMAIIECANMLADLTTDGRKILQEHMKDFGEILLHVLAGDLVTEPLIELLQFHKERMSAIEIYAKAIEVMWKIGNEEVLKWNSMMAGVKVLEDTD